MSEANVTRGEIALELVGKEYVLRPSYEAISRFEEKLGKGLLALVRCTGDGTITQREAATIATECIRAHGRAAGDAHKAAADPQKIAEMIMDSEGGLAGCLGRLSIVLGLAATGGYTSAGELKPGTTLTTTNPATESDQATA